MAIEGYQKPETTLQSDDFSPTLPHRFRRWGVLLLQILGGGGLLLIIGVISVVYSLSQSFEDRIYPNITIQGVAVSEMSKDESQQAVEAYFSSFLNQPVILTYGEKQWFPTIEDLGIQIHITEAVEQAYAIGHQSSQHFQQIAAIWLFGRDIPVQMTVDQQTMQRYFQAIAQEITTPATDATIFVNNAYIQTTTAIPGRQVQINDMVQDVSAAVQTIQSQTVPVRTRLLLPLLNDTETQQAQQAIDTLLQAPIILDANGQTWEWTVEDLSRMIRIYRHPGSDTGEDDLLVTLDRTMIRNRLETIADETATGRKYPRVAWNGGDLTIIEEGESGIRVDVSQAEELIMEATTSSQRTVSLPFTDAPPLITEKNLDELGITELLGVGHSDFTGSEDYRITNIQAGMNLLHGLLIAPGEEFSFNRTIGAISEENGFVEGYAIVENRTQLEWGGGICQDSTTIFRAVFWAGLPITERWGHAFYIDWYDAYGYGEYGDGPGMDATIFTGGPDFKFVNDTDNWILLQTYVNVSQALAEIAIYGTSDGRVVKLEGPEISNRKPAPTEPRYIPNPDISPGSRYRSDRARGGMDIAFTRIIEKDGKELQRSTFTTRFKPWPNIYEMNPVDLAPNGRPWPTATPELTKTVEQENPQPVDPQPVDPQPVDPQPVDPQPVDPQPVDPQPVDPQPVEPQPVDPQPIDPQPIDPQPVDPQPIDPQPQPIDPQPQPIEPQPQPVDPQPQPVDPQPQPVDPQPQPIDPQPQPIEPQPQPVEPQPQPEPMLPPDEF